MADMRYAIALVRYAHGKIMESWGIDACGNVWGTPGYDSDNLVMDEKTLLSIMPKALLALANPPKQYKLPWNNIILQQEE